MKNKNEKTETNIKICKYCIFSQWVDNNNMLGCKVKDPGVYRWVKNNDSFCQYGQLIPSIKE